MKKNKAWAIIMLGLIILLPFLSWYVMKEGSELRSNNTASPLYTLSSYSVPAYQFISQRGDTISAQNMNGKVCVYELYSDDCYAERFTGRHKLFELQEDYYGKTKSLRILSINLTDATTENADLIHYSTRYAAREIWHVAGGDTAAAQQLYASFRTYLIQKNISEENFNCPEHVFLVDRKGNICGAYNLNDTKEYNALFTDILYTIDRKE